MDKTTLKIIESTLTLILGMIVGITHERYIVAPEGTQRNESAKIYMKVKNLVDTGKITNEQINAAAKISVKLQDDIAFAIREIQEGNTNKTLDRIITAHGLIEQLKALGMPVKDLESNLLWVRKELMKANKN